MSQVYQLLELLCLSDNLLENLHSMDDFPWEEMRVPVLLIHGDRDALISVEYSREAARRIPNATLVVIQGGRHE